MDSVRKLTREDRLYHELRCINKQLEMVLSEYEAEREQPNDTPPETGSFRALLRAIKK